MSTIIGRKQLNFKYKKLFRGNEATGWSVKQDKDQKMMYRVVWPDGVESDDFYDYTRAREHCARLYLKSQGEDLDLNSQEIQLEARTEV